MADTATFKIADAGELQYHLRIGFQPAVLCDDEFAARVLAEMIDGFRAAGITRRRLTNAFDVVAVPAAAREALLAGMAS